MKSVATVFVALLLVVPTLALAQMGHGGGMMGHGGGMMGGGMGQGHGMGQGSMGQGGMGSGMGNHGSMGQGMGSGMDHDTMTQSMHGAQQPLTPAEPQSSAFRMLQQKTGLSAANLQQMYASSGARNFGQFASAMVVSKNLGLNANQVLSGMQTQSLGQTLQNLGVSQGAAKSALKQAHSEISGADNNGTQY